MAASASQIINLTIFTQAFIRVQIKENIKTHVTGPPRWIPRTDGQ